MLKCPICGLSYEDFHLLVMHVYQLAMWYPARPNGKGVGRRKRHYDWLIAHGVPINYEAIKGFLEGFIGLV